MDLSTHLRHQSNQSVSFMLLTNIKNMKEIKKLLLADKLQAAVVNPTYIYDSDQLLLAAHKSLFNKENQMLKTKSLFTEVLYNLYPSKSIKDALTTFGVQENGTEAIFVFFNCSSDEVPSQFISTVSGSLRPFELISEFQDLEAIGKVYKISDISDKEYVHKCIITKIASKDLL